MCNGSIIIADQDVFSCNCKKLLFCHPMSICPIRATIYYKTADYCPTAAFCCCKDDSYEEEGRCEKLCRQLGRSKIQTSYILDAIIDEKRFT